MGELAVELRDVSCTFSTPAHTSYVALSSVDFEARRGSFTAIVGPTGCGKSTLLNLAAGLIRPNSGEVRISGSPLCGLNQQAGYLFQQDALLPWKTVLDNVSLGPILRGVPRSEAEAEARRWLAKVGLTGFEDRYPPQLSGGMRKRCGLAQTLIVNPEILLMDEPFSALDVQTRQLMENELLSLWAESAMTVLFVTHDLEEAISLADEVVVLSAGPGTSVVGRYDIDLPRPRNVAEARFDRHFNELYEAIWSDLRDEVMKSHARAFQR